MKFSRRVIVFIAFLSLFLILLCVFQNNRNQKVKIVKEEGAIESENKKSFEDEQKLSEEESFEIVKEIQSSENEKIKIPEKTFINVPFLSQAPFGEWDERHEEACEETSLIMMYYYLSGESLNAEVGEKEIQEMIDFQLEEYEDYRDSSASELVEIAREFYGMNELIVLYDFEKEDIKRELAKGNPVIIPAAGRLLGNPYYTQPGPLYHNMILVGYEGDEIISNDPGTRRGEGYRYDIDVLYNAVHDFTGNKEDILSGRKAMIVVE
ncbi:MAG: C39 family peptidase [Candidatus Moranbacteria bacterium]|nr:C39 family peptidase [Candidatus Moranbacteria bacterium]